MTDLPRQPHQCPCCELRFAWWTELEDHVAAEHAASGSAITGVGAPGHARRKEGTIHADHR